MAEAHGAHENALGGAHGDMDIKDQKDTFHGFMVATIWGCGWIAMSVALMVVAFAMNLGWWPGMAAFLVIGVGVGLIFQMSSTWWAVLVGTTILLVIGGAIVPLIAAMAA